MTTTHPHSTHGKRPELVPYGETNLGTPLELVEGPVVGNDLFFVRSNYTVPTVDPDRWRLRVHGLVDREVELSLADLRQLPQRSVTAVLECAGNGRIRFAPTMDGTPWHDDAVGCARWSGVPLRHVLDLAGLRPDVVDIVSQGADDPAMRRGLPLRAALTDDCLLALDMNGAPLPIAHGAPVRLLVPGWAGIASTKWIVDLEAIPHTFDGYWNAEKYVMVSASGQVLSRVEEMPVKSVIARPSAGSVLPPGPVTASGYAWSGTGSIEAIDVCVGDGQFARADITHAAGPRAWVGWSYSWVAPPGPVTVRSRARDSTGQVQPLEPIWNAQGYLMNAVGQQSFVIADA
ncbi:MAG: sulfite oxidase [Geodermatophilaceae bacterium]|nr:sulfite oxidase [Geodermatophilaceae bacterium]